MNIKLKVLRGILAESIDQIDAGNSNKTEEELDEIISSMTNINRGIKRISKLLAPVVDCFAVATINEGITLREMGIKQDILIFGICGALILPI